MPEKYHLRKPDPRTRNRFYKWRPCYGPNDYGGWECTGERSATRARKVAAERVEQALAPENSLTLDHALCSYRDVLIQKGRSRKKRQERARGVGSEGRNVEVYENSCAHIRGTIEGDTRLCDLRPRHAFAHWVRRGEKVSDRTIAKELGHLKAALTHARKERMHSWDLLDFWPEGLSSASGVKERYLTRAEYDVLLPLMGPTTSYERQQRHGVGRHGGAHRRAQLVEHDEAMGEDLRPHFLGLLWLFCRSDELYSFRPDDVRKGSIRKYGAKTERARTAGVWVPIHPELKPWIKSLLASHPGDDSPLFPMSSPNPAAQRRKLLRKLESACKRAGIPKCTQNDLRRTAATWSRDAGVDKDTVKDWMLHSGKSRMLDDVYAKLSPEKNASEMAKLHAPNTHQPPTLRVVRGSRTR